MDLIRLYLVNILRPVVEDPKLSDPDDEEDDEEEDEDEDEAENEHGVYDGDGATSGLEVEGRQAAPDKKQRLPKHRTRTSKNAKNERGSLKNIELLDSSGPKLIHGIEKWLVLYQIIGQLNWLEKPLIVSIIYKSILIPTCVYIVYKDIVKSVSASKITDEFKNPIFVFISLSAAATLILLASLTFYNNLFNWCPLFKVLTTEKLCFVRREVQDIIGNNTLAPILCFYAYNCVLFRMLTTRNFQEFINNFDILYYVRDLFVSLCVGYHLVGMCYTDFYIRICFGVWIIAMKTNLENRFAYLQKHQRVKQRSSLKRRPSRANTAGGSARARMSKRKATSSSMVSNFSTTSTIASSMKNDHDDSTTTNQLVGHRVDLPTSNSDFQEINSEILSQDSIATATTLNATNATTGGIGSGANDQQAPTMNQYSDSSQQQAPPLIPNRMTLDDFRAKYKIDTMDEIQKNLNTMDDHLEVSRDFQNSSLVLITLSAFLTNGALLLLAYNLLANQGDYYHGFVIVLIAASYTLTIFMCYIGDSWILYALESFVQTVEDEYFLQSANDEELDSGTSADTTGQQTTKRTASEANLLTTNGANDQALPEAAVLSPAEHWPMTPPVLASETASETMPYADLIRQHHQLFIIKKRDVLFCREFLNQFQNHLATPWSKLTVKVQLHMLRTFVTLIAAQIIFDREH